MRSFCYGCPSENVQWRGPRYGWLCLRCFSETIHPTVRLAEHIDLSGSSTTQPDDTPLITQTEDPNGVRTWLLLVPQPQANGGTEQHQLGTDLDPEQAVDEAKWLLNKRAWTAGRPA
ncbi:hypothetical protein [Phytoactinopolyspora limicola]|uniref:hypothetical protein n=1 Tax=Phytoactinopolyspora limicola TaxID=2715536 RepID=UPI00140B9F6B|nr:hypothetical protein [Phytoactinopolyspora limicola]